VASAPGKTAASRAELTTVAARSATTAPAMGVTPKPAATASVASVAVADGEPTQKDIRPAAPTVESAVAKVRRRTGEPSPAPVMAAQKSTRVRRRHRSLFDRLFGWLFGR
jgi:hypothetical protein